jgi:hypothetical protein
MIPYKQKRHCATGISSNEHSESWTVIFIFIQLQVSGPALPLARAMEFFA